jgi:hypothetical protein
MTSLHQRLNQENVHGREGAVERLQSRWSSSSRDIFDRPPSHPPTRQQMGGRSRSGSEKESHHKDPGNTGGVRRGSAGGRLERGNPKWDSSSGIITDSPPLQPLSCRGRENILRPQLTRHRPRRLFTRGRNYPNLFQKLIVQGLLRIEENDEVDEENEVTIFCRGDEEAPVNKVLPAAVKEYAEIMKQESYLLPPMAPRT